MGCFSGDTKIALLDGTCKALKELAQKEENIYAYSLDADLQLVPGKAVPKLTRKNAEIMEVVISSGESIKCTPDHKFMLLDGTYKEAQKLKPFDSLMPLYRSYASRDGYEYIKTSKKKGIRTHEMVASYFLGERKEDDLIHHKDGHWYNNDPSNIEYKNKSEHSRYHRTKRVIFGTEEFKEKRLNTLKEKGFYSPELYENKKAIAIENINAYNKSSKKKEQDKLAGKRGAKYLIKYNKSEKGRAKSYENGKKNKFGRNHKVLYTRKLNIKEDVYCLTVEKYHNFALASGVFVHNCGGVTAVKTNIRPEEITTDQIKEIMGDIRKHVPVGFSHHKEDKYVNFSSYHTEIVEKQLSSAKRQVGTLGGGNHFIEIQKGNDGYIWFMIHSGSRNVGLQVAKYYNNKAKELNERWHTTVDPKWDLAFLPIDDKAAIQYIGDMQWCLDFAKANRNMMALQLMSAFIATNSNVVFTEHYDIHHNYAQIENHFGHNVWVHRKGATSAYEGEIGIIPGSQGTASYIVRGLGNEKSFRSCSHGAGRCMGRKQAQRELDLATEKQKLDDKGIIHAIRNQKDLDEASGAYKDIDVVMEEQKDLVSIEVKLEPLAVIKG